MSDDTLEMGREVSLRFRIADDIAPVIDAMLVEENFEAINPIISDGFALYEKTRSFYLRMAQLPNPDHEVLFDEQAEQIFASMDTLAERVREMGGTPLRSISHSGEIQSVETYQVDSLSLSEMTEELIADNKQIAASLQSARQVFEEQHNLLISTLLVDVLVQTKTRIKQLREAVIGYSAERPPSR